MNDEITANIKMFRMGELGDCFLLRFTQSVFITHVLIDCGTFRNGDLSKSRLKKVVQEIKTQIGNAPLDIIVGTHQHNDHLSGFVHEEKEFRQLGINQVWLSWLDDADDPLALRIGRDFNNLLLSLQKLSFRLNSLTSKGIDEAAEKLDSVLEFYGIERGATERKPAKLPKNAITILKSLGSKKPMYLRPGQVFDLPGIDREQVKVYVLGPPKNEKLLKSINPKADETYDPELMLASTHTTRFMQALDGLYGKVNEYEDEAAYPFYEADSDLPFSKGIAHIYESKKNKWRAIDDDWLKQAERIALWMDSYTNNSSLVLAFELVRAGKVLLFAADAQTGNWNSWKEIKWETSDKDLNWKSLLKKTVLYKVGHHASHNATLVEGLNNMSHEELVAMIPVDVTDGNITKVKHPWKMPAVNLYKNLLSKTKNRVLRMDKGFAEGCQPKATASKCPWKKNNLNVPDIKDLYIEYEIKG